MYLQECYNRECSFRPHEDFADLTYLLQSGVEFVSFSHPCAVSSFEVLNQGLSPVSQVAGFGLSWINHGLGKNAQGPILSAKLLVNCSCSGESRGISIKRTVTG